MKDKVVKNVSCDTLAPILLTDISLEERPEPFRLQRNVIFSVDFYEYKRFVEVYLDKIDYLSQPTSILKLYLATGDNDKLYSAFLADMAYGIAKELYYSETFKKPSSIILHCSTDASILPFDNVLTMYKDIKTFTEDRIRLFMSSKGFQLPLRFKEWNINLWKYANVLLFFSMAPGKEWMLSKEDVACLI